MHLGLSIAFWFVLGAGFYLFAYNSGYGYDAIEYLILGQSLLDGYSPFEFSPSKPPGIYYLVAAFLRIFPDAGHVEISALVTGIFLAICLASYGLLRAIFGKGTAYLGTILVALCAAFMELNFLETEGLVFLVALPSLLALRNAVRSHSVLWLLLAGFCIGVAAFFKTVALFYLIGATVFFLLWRTETQHFPPLHWVWPWVGACLAVGLQAGFFAYRGELKSFFFWSYIFPTLHYPADRIYLAKLLTKLAWFWALLAVTLLLALLRSSRHVLTITPYPTAALCLGLSALLALTKSQPSHYVFPAAAFLCFFIAPVWAAFIERSRIAQKAWLLIATLGIAGVIVSALAYRPTAPKRFLTIRDFSEEECLAQTLRLWVPRGQRMLCMGHPLPYWLARRYPAIPTVATHVQLAYWLSRNPRLFFEALEDPSLQLVEFDPHSFRFRAPSLKDAKRTREFADAFEHALLLRFARVEAPTTRYVFWRRRETPLTL